MGQKKNWGLKKKLGLKILLVQTKLPSKANFCRTNFCPTKFLNQKKSVSQKKVGPKRIFESAKTILSEQILGLKKIWVSKSQMDKQ